MFVTRHATSVVLSAAAAIGALAGCASEEEVNYADPSQLGARSAEGPGDGGPACIVDGACAISWSKHVYPRVLDAPLGGELPSGACGVSDCHFAGAGGLVFKTGDAESSYVSLLDYALVGARQYIVPCHPELSHIMCNLELAEGVDNPYVGADETFTGGCGSLMPKLSSGVAAAPLNQEQLDTLADWITCGAPDN